MENKRNELMWLICTVIIMITCMHCNLSLCYEVLHTVNQMLVDYPVVVTTEKVVEVPVKEEKEEEVVKDIEKTIEKIEDVEEEIKNEVSQKPVITSGILTKSGGVTWFEGHKETYYNLPMKKVVSNAQNKGIEGEYWEREDGCKMLGDYIMVAADQKIHPYGSIVMTSLGEGIVVDTGTFIQTNPQQIDIAVTW